MAKITYDYNYDFHEATCKFEVDTNVFTKEMAQETLNFFTWEYNKENDPVDEVMKKYAMQVIQTATFESYNVYGVISEFEDKEGFCKLDGSTGITLLEVSEFEFYESSLYVEKTTA